MKRVNDNDVYWVRAKDNDDSYLYVVKSEDNLTVEIISKYGFNSFEFNQEVIDALQSILTTSKRH
jgi:hypothetical protein